MPLEQRAAEKKSSEKMRYIMKTNHQRSKKLVRRNKIALT